MISVAMGASTSSTTKHRSGCPLDCPDACSLEVTVHDGEVVRVDGDRRNPYTDGYICGKVRALPTHVHGPLRLRHPLRRVGAKGAGAFERCSWDDALDTIATRLVETRDRFGGEAILPYYYGGSNGYLSHGSADFRLFRRLGASRLLRTVCAAPTSAAASGLYGKMAGVALPDYVHARLIVIWGMNPSASGIHLVPVVREARRRGARLVVVDPRRIPLAAEADLHLAPRPGTDLPVALALHRLLFERGGADRAFLADHATGADELLRRASSWTPERAAEVAGVGAADIERLAAWYAEGSPAVIRCGWGIERNRNGGSAAAAILALPAVAGKFGVRGGGYTMSNSGAYAVGAAAAIAEPEPATRAVNMNHLGQALLDLEPPVRVLFVYDSNAVATSPNQNLVRRGLGRDGLFTVVFDQTMTDTARWADIVLPATTFLEHRELSRGYGAYVMQHIEPVVEPVGEARSNLAVFVELLHRTDLARPGDPESPDEIERALLENADAGVRESLAATGVAPPPAGPNPVQMVDVLPATSDGKIHLCPESLDREAPHGIYGYAPDPDGARLALISPNWTHSISSSLGHLRQRQARLAMSPRDAAARGIADGDRVRASNELGEVICRVEVTSAVRPGVVSLPKGLWSHHTENGATTNALSPDTLTDIGAGACFNDARVDVEKLA